MMHFPSIDHHRPWHTAYELNVFPIPSALLAVMIRAKLEQIKQSDPPIIKKLLSDHLFPIVPGAS